MLGVVAYYSGSVHLFYSLPHNNKYEHFVFLGQTIYGIECEPVIENQFTFGSVFLSVN